MHFRELKKQIRRVDKALADNGMSADDVQKILNLKHVWEFILDRDVIGSASNYYLLYHIAKLVNEGLYFDGGRIREI